MDKDIEARELSVKVEGLNDDVREFKDSLLGVEAKIENFIASFSREIRSAITTLSTQLADSKRTPWGTLIGVLSITIIILGGFGTQALYPMQADIKSLKDQIVPREEINFRSKTTIDRLERLNAQVDQIQAHRYDEMVREMTRLQAENAALRAKSN